MRCSILSLVILCHFTRQSSPDSCFLDKQGTPAIDLLVQFQSQLIKQFLTANSTRVTLLYSAKQSKAKLQKIVYRFAEPYNKVFYVGAEFQIVNGKTEVNEFFQTNTLNKINDFFDLNLSDESLINSDLTDDLIVFLDDYLGVVTTKTYQPNTGSVSVPVFIGNSLNNDLNSGNKTQLTNSSTLNSLPNITQPNLTVVPPPITAPPVPPTPSVSVPVQAVTPPVTKSTPPVTTPPPLTNGAWIPPVIEPIPSPTSGQPATVVTPSTDPMSTPSQPQFPYSFLTEPDKVVVDYIATNFKLAYAFAIFQKPIVSIVTSSQRRLAQVYQSHAQVTRDSQPTSSQLHPRRLKRIHSKH